MILVPLPLSLSLDTLPRNSSLLFRYAGTQFVLKATVKGAKYSLSAAVELWEEALRCIEKRETLLHELAEFERTASNPARLFEKGASVSLDAEAKERRRLEIELEKITKATRRVMEALKERLGDDISLGGVSYR